MSRLRPFGDNPHRQYLGMTVESLMGHLESLIHEEEDRGDVAAHSKTPRGRRLSRAYDALAALEDVRDA